MKDVTERVDEEVQSGLSVNESEYYLVALGMREMGGSFARALSKALMLADYENQKKIKLTWPEYWEKYLRFGKRLYNNGERW